MPQSPRPSALQDYMQNYGARLQSMLQSPTDAAAVTDPGSVLGRTSAPAGEPAPVTPMQAAAPTQQLNSQASPASAMHEQSLLEQGGEQSPQVQGKGFADYWREMPQAEQKQQVDSLEQTLAKGNQTIDSAYDDMIRQLGSRPDGKLSREDKGMLLMEFGLSLMSNSARGAYGDDLGGAIGAAGSQTLGRYQQQTRGRQQAYDSRVSAIEGARAKSKSSLAEKGTVEQIKAGGAAQRAEAAADRRSSELAGTIDTEQGIYGRTHSGQISALTDPQTGQPLKGRERASEPLVAVLEEDGTEVWVPRSEAAGRKKRPPGSSTSALSGLKSSDSNTLYRQAAGLFGGMFDPMTGRISGLSKEQTQMVQQIAARGGDLYLAGEKNHAKAINRAFEEIRRGEQPGDSALADTPTEFANEAEAQAAAERGEIKRGDVVVIRGRRVRAQ